MSLVNDILKVPPVTRFFCGTTLVVTLSTMLGLTEVRNLVYIDHLVFGRWQVWRLFTSFFHGGEGVELLMKAHMLYRSLYLLERTVYRDESFVVGWQLSLCSLAIFLLSLPFPSPTFNSQLVICITHLTSLLNPEARIELFGIVPTREKYLPYLLCALSFWQYGWKLATSISIVGLLVGHLWFLFEHTSYLRPGSKSGRARFPALSGLQRGWDGLSQPPDWFKFRVVGRGTARDVPRGRPGSKGPAAPLGAPEWRYGAMGTCGARGCS